jgi:hypothetical protein
MTDFYSRLEHQLLDAASRRAAQAPLRRASGARGRALAAVLACLVLSAGVAGIVRLAGAPDAAEPESRQRAIPPDVPTHVPRIRLDGIVVAVLNATTTAGVARGAADDLHRQGATIAAVASAPEQTLARSIVHYRPGAEAAGRRVARVLGIARLGPTSGEDDDLVPPADVVVRLGHDLCGRWRSSCAPRAAGVP